MPINQPSNQIKFTNVSVVRLKKGRFLFFTPLDKTTDYGTNKKQARNGSN